ncbi:MAG: hypothetical protein ACXWLS_13095 [Myxococcaceae bacterium]
MTLAALLLAVLAAPATDGGPLQQVDPHAGHHAQVDARGDHAMGFSHDRAAHHFVLTPDGGLIIAEARDPTDTATRDAIRGHFNHIARAFAAGDFALPYLIHARNPPGVPEMQRLRDQITYTLQDTATGARVRISTRDPEALKAVHVFLRFQIEDHRTGDPTSIQASTGP